MLGTMIDDELLSPGDVERLAGEAGVSLPDLCGRAGISHTTFYRWKAGKTEPTLEVYRRIRDTLKSLRDAA